MKNDVTQAAAAAVVTYDPKSGLETAKTALDNLKHALERLDKSATLDIKDVESLRKPHLYKNKGAYGLPECRRLKTEDIADTNLDRMW